MVDQFGDDTRRIDHALAVFSHADKIRDIEGGDALVVTAAALLHDIGIQEAERIYGSNAPRYQEQLGPPIARRIMEDLEIGPATVEHVTRIVGSHHSAGDIDTIEFRIIWDADALVNLADEGPARTADQWEKTIGKVFKTDAGRERAGKIFIGG
jgi:HD superfamily phosphodiesterase